MAEDMQGAKGSGMGAAELVASINDRMMQLSDMIAQSPVDPAIKQQMSAQIKGFQDFAEVLNRPAGEKVAPEEPPGPANVPMEAGAAKVIQPL